MRNGHSRRSAAANNSGSLGTGISPPEKPLTWVDKFPSPASFLLGASKRTPSPGGQIEVALFSPFRLGDSDFGRNRDCGLDGLSASSKFLLGTSSLSGSPEILVTLPFVRCCNPRSFAYSGTARALTEIPLSIKGLPLSQSMYWLKGTNLTTRATSRASAIRFREETVCFPVVHRHPVAIDLRRAVWATRIERGGLILRGFRSPEHFRRARLVELGLDAAPPDGLARGVKNGIRDGVFA